jgi:hypothetical protein
MMSTEERSHHLLSANVDRLETLSQATSTTTSQIEHDLLQLDPEELYWPVSPQSLTMTGARQWAKSRGFISSEGWSMQKLLASGERFSPVPRVSASDPCLAASIDEHEQFGIPLIIEKWHMHPKWPRDLFTIEKFRADSPPGMIGLTLLLFSPFYLTSEQKSVREMCGTGVIENCLHLC